MQGHVYRENDKLWANSKLYKGKAYVYEIFSQAEDKPQKVINYYKEIIRNKIVVDLWCGTGKFIQNLAPLTKKYIGIDISKNQLEIAQEKIKSDTNIELINVSAHNIPIQEKSVDIVIANRFIGSIHDLSLRKNIIKEIQRILKKNWSIYFVENDTGWDFKDIIEKWYGDKKTQIKLKWLEEEWFEKVESFETYFEFESVESARNTFKEIWWNEIALNINKKKILHNIVIYKNG